MNQSVSSLVSDDPAVLVENAEGVGSVVLVCEHAGRMIPAFVGSPGVDEEVMSLHIAWDLGAAELARSLSRLLDAPLVLQRYSRLVYDCNRRFDADDVIVTESDGISIPGNIDISEERRRQRFEAVYQPFEKAIRELLDAREAKQQDTVLVTIHSFTPVYKGRRRSLDLGILHDSDSRLADALLLQTERNSDYRSARNQPYSSEDGVTHTLIIHGINRGLANVMLEIRNDLIADAEGQKQWAERISGLLNAVRLNS